MKIGDTIPVTIAGQEVCRATVKGMEDGTATLVVPATLVVMATRTELTVEQREPEGAEVLITGVDRVDNSSTDSSTDAAADAASEAPAENNAEEVPATNNNPAEANSEAPATAVEPAVETVSNDSAAE